MIHTLFKCREVILSKCFLSVVILLYVVSASVSANADTGKKTVLKIKRMLEMSDKDRLARYEVIKDKYKVDAKALTDNEKLFIDFYKTYKEADEIFNNQDVSIDKKISKLEMLKRKNKYQFVVYGDLGILYLHKNNFIDAIANIEAALQLYPEKQDKIRSELLATLGKAYFETEKYAEARDSYEKAIEMFNKNERVYFNLGRTYYRLDNPGKAIYAFREALRLSEKPDYATLYNLGLAYVSKGGLTPDEKDYAAKKLQEAIELATKAADTEVVDEANKALLRLGRSVYYPKPLKEKALDIILKAVAFVLTIGIVGLIIFLVKSRHRKKQQSGLDKKSQQNTINEHNVLGWLQISAALIVSFGFVVRYNELMWVLCALYVVIIGLVSGFRLLWK